MDKHYNVILIDDDPEEHEIFLMALNDLDLSISCLFYHSWSNAITFLEDPVTKAPDFIFIDWSIFGIQSDTYIVRIRQIQKLQVSKLVIYSGYPQSDYMDNLLAAYDCTYLSKNDSIAALSKKIKSILIAG